MSLNTGELFERAFGSWVNLLLGALRPSVPFWGPFRVALDLWGAQDPRLLTPPSTRSHTKVRHSPQNPRNAEARVLHTAATALLAFFGTFLFGGGLPEEGSEDGRFRLGSPMLKFFPT